MKLNTKDITLAALFAALAAIAAMIVRFGPTAFVPYSLVPFVVILAGAILGPRLGAISMIVYVLVGLIGVPVFASAPFGGVAYFLKPSAGFLIGFIVAAYLVGLILHVKKNPSLFRYAFAVLVGVAVIYLIGLPYMYFILNVYMGKVVPVAKVLELGFVPFILFDLAKAALAIAVTRAVMVRVPGLTDK